MDLRAAVFKTVAGGAFIACLASVTIGAPASARSIADAPLEIDFANNGRVTDQAGREVVLNGSTGDEAESINSATTSDGRLVVVIRQSALNTPLPDVPEAEMPDAETMKAATDYEGALPPELVGTDFIEDGGPIKEEGSVASAPIAASELELRTMAQYENEGFGCLTGACGTKTVYASKTY